LVNFKDKATLHKLLVTLSNWPKYCPKHLPHVILLLPTPVRKAFGFHLTYSSFLSPSYHGKGEKTAWHTWNAWPEASTVFRKLSQYPPVLGEDDQSILEKFVVIMYDMLLLTFGDMYFGVIFSIRKIQIFVRTNRHFPYQI
jgi:hypothetical protein